MAQKIMSCDLENLVTENIRVKDLEAFFAKYCEKSVVVDEFLSVFSKYVSREPSEGRLFDSPIDSKDLEKDEIPQSVFGKYSDDELMLLETLMYVGRDIKQGALIIRECDNEQLCDVLQACVLFMRHEHFIFGEPIDKAVLGVAQKAASAVYDYMIESVNVLKKFNQPSIMQTIIEAIKERAVQCAKKGVMFSLPSIAAPYVVEHQDHGGEGDFWRLEDGESWITIESKSRDGSRVFQINPDRSSIVVEGEIPEKVSFSDSWNESV